MVSYILFGDMFIFVAQASVYFKRHTLLEPNVVSNLTQVQPFSCKHSLNQKDPKFTRYKRDFKSASL